MTGYALRRLVEASPDGILVVGPDGRVRFSNAATAALLRREPTEMIGYEFGYPAITSEPVELVLSPQESEPSFVDMRASEIEWEGETALLLSLRDVTAQRRQEQRIKQLNSALRTELEIEELILREKDPETLLRSAREILLNRRGYLAASIVVADDDGGLRPLTKAVRDDADATPAATDPTGDLPPCCEEALRSGTEHIHWALATDDSTHRASAGALDHGRRIILPIENEGRVFGILSLLAPADVERHPEEVQLIRRLAAELGHALLSLELASARREAEDQLRASESRFRLLFENSIDAIVIADEHGNYVHVNEAACDLLGYEREELLSMSVADLSVPDDGPPLDEQFRDYVAGGGKKGGTFTFCRPDESTRVAEYRAFALSRTRFASVLRDVTDRQSLEDQLRQSQRMEAVGRLAGGIAHDFNNLLTAIIAFAGFVRDELPQGDQRRDDVSEILRTADRAAALTRQLLAFSRRQPIAPRNVDLNVLVASAMNLLRRTIGEDVELVARPGDALWPVFVDPGQFEQVVMNLAINARDAMPLGGRLVLETTNEARSLPDGGDEVVLRVHDDGVGMTDEVVKQIFEPFFTTKEEGKGTGLGLSMVYGLVTQAGGRISVESEVGRGTTFQIRLPRAKQLAQRPAQSSRSPAVRHGSETILVVEDELVVRRALTRLLTRGGYTVLEAENGERALSLFREKADEVDLVLSDVVMPGMNGPETVKELRRLKPETKVLFMTGYTDDTTIRHSVSREEVELITKPFSREGLLTRVRRVLEE